MGRSARQLVSLTLACAFSSCFAEVALGVELSPETTSFPQVATSSQPLSFYRSSPHQSTTVDVNSTGPLQTTPVSHRTTEQLEATSAPGQHGAGQAGAGTAPAESPGTASQATASLTAAVENTTRPSASSTRHGGRPGVTTGAAAAATNTSLKQETASSPGAAASTAWAATGTRRAGASTRSQGQTTGTATATGTSSTAGTPAGTPTAPMSPASTAGTPTAPMSPASTAGTPTAPTSPASTAGPRPAPQPAAIPTGTYTLSDGNGTCIKAVMGLQLMAQNTEQEQMDYVTVNPNATKISGSCGMVQSELNLTFSAGFVNITFVKQAPSYSVTRIESRIQFSSEGMLYYAALNEKLFTTKLGNSFKCASRQIFLLERNFQILFVHMQLQAFDIVGNQFGKEEECFPDRNSKVAPIAVCLSILGLFVIVFATFLISRRKPHRGYQRI